tara:strand:+ start:159 stop:503 length:345 start_codon:yes stop_codon:yes gene_type:complete
MTIYSQSANPDATNSELDAKQIITHKQLNSAQLDEVIEQYVELVVDSMDMKTLVCYAQEQLTDYFSKLSQHELKEEIDCYSDDLYYELVDNIQINEITEQLDTTNPYKSIPSRY